MQFTHVGLCCDQARALRGSCGSAAILEFLKIQIHIEQLFSCLNVLWITQNQYFLCLITNLYTTCEEAVLSNNFSLRTYHSSSFTVSL